MLGLVSAAMWFGSVRGKLASMRQEFRAAGERDIGENRSSIKENRSSIKENRSSIKENREEPPTPSLAIKALLRLY